MLEQALEEQVVPGKAGLPAIPSCVKPWRVLIYCGEFTVELVGAWDLFE